MMTRIVLRLIIIYILLSVTHENDAQFQGENRLSRPQAEDEENPGQRPNLEQRHCDMDNCETIVIKCRSTNRCSCDIKSDAPCVKDCVDCLEEKFGKCCACVGEFKPFND